MFLAARFVLWLVCLMVGLAVVFVVAVACVLVEFWRLVNA